MKPQCPDCNYMADYTRLIEASQKANNDIRVQIMQVIKVTTFKGGKPTYHYFDQIGNPLNVSRNNM